MNWVDAKAFLSRVVAWPVNGIGHVNLHYSMVNTRGGKDIVTGKPYQEIDQLLGFCNWAEQTNNIKELWYCTSLQSQTGLTSHGKVKAVRLKQNAVFLKAIWVDIDVGNTPDKPDKHYDTQAEAWAAITKFRADAGLPQFSAAVNSGGGLHIYWISKTPLTPDVWQHYANGLKALLLKHNIKCDSGLTGDSARILRIPGTFNHKYVPPKPVELLPLPARDYDFELELAFLKGLVPVPTSSSPQTSDSFDLAIFAGKTPILALDNTKLSDGLEPRDFLLDPKPIFKKCGFLQDALFEGGKSYDNPLWNLTLLCSTFLENGNALAHEMSKGHAQYTFEETQTQYERKVAERHARGLGYPSCATIKGERCTACATCPLFKNGKSPLNIRPDKKVTATVTTAHINPILAADPGMMLPEGYCIGHDGCIYKVIEREDNSKGEAQAPVLVKLFHSKLSSPWAQREPDALNFITTVDKGNVHQASILVTEFRGNKLFDALNREKVKYIPSNMRFTEDFFMAWLTKLHEAQAAEMTLPFGWVGPAGAHTGFVYGGTVFHTNGRETPAGAGDGRMRTWYKPHGSLKPWLDACKMITDMKRPELDTLIALSFAAPLMTFGAEYSTLLSAWSSESGTQKSSALKVGLAVWGHPKETKEVTKSTAVSVLLKMGELKSLPLYWDEITTEFAQKNLAKVMFTGSDGTDGGRGRPDLSQQKKGTWQLAIGACANLSFVDHLVKEMPTTPAGLYRVLEYNVRKADPYGPGMIDSTYASRVLQQLEGHYGVMGLMYAKLLAKNAVRLDRETSELIVGIGQDLGGDVNSQERYWKVLLGCLIMGATLANQLGATLDVPAMTTFLYGVYNANRARVESENLIGGNADNTEELLTTFLKDHSDQAIWTSAFPTGFGRKSGVNLLNGPKPDGNVRHSIQVRWDVNDQMLRISKPAMAKWLEARNIGTSAMTRGLETVFGMTMDKRVITAGTVYTGLQERVLNVPCANNQALMAALNLWSPVAAPTAVPPSKGSGVAA